MSDAIIIADNIGKRYQLSHQAPGARNKRFSEVINDSVKGLFQRSKGTQTSSTQEDFWALKDVSFEIKKGEVVGIIGRNGAGKSTLLKILSRITEPTNGRITLKGRVASLLEVGTGFHPELTGRENIFLNGAILGMSKAEIKSKFDEIVAFAEIERFLDTPVKRYSSGMYVRLAFAVAAHLEPEILIVDEVLAVGDHHFQQKCLGKMHDVASGGRTVLVVSHNMALISSLCDRAILLASGMVASAGATAQVLSEYSLQQNSNRSVNPQNARRIDSTLSIETFVCSPESASTGEANLIIVEATSATGTQIFEFCLLVYHSSGQRVAVIDLRQSAGAYRLEANQSARWEIQVSELPLVEGEYSLGLYCRTNESKGDHYDMGLLNITPGATSSLALPYAMQHRGYIELKYQFTQSVAPLGVRPSI